MPDPQLNPEQAYAIYQSAITGLEELLADPYLSETERAEAQAQLAAFRTDVAEMERQYPQLAAGRGAAAPMPTAPAGGRAAGQGLAVPQAGRRPMPTAAPARQPLVGLDFSLGGGGPRPTPTPVAGGLSGLDFELGEPGASWEDKWYGRERWRDTRGQKPSAGWEQGIGGGTQPEPGFQWPGLGETNAGTVLQAAVQALIDREKLARQLAQQYPALAGYYAPRVQDYTNLANAMAQGLGGQEGMTPYQGMQMGTDWAQWAQNYDLQRAQMAQQQWERMLPMRLPEGVTTVPGFEAGGPIQKMYESAGWQYDPKQWAPIPLNAPGAPGPAQVPPWAQQLWNQGADILPRLKPGGSY